MRQVGVADQAQVHVVGTLDAQHGVELVQVARRRAGEPGAQLVEARLKVGALEHGDGFFLARRRRDFRARRAFATLEDLHRAAIAHGYDFMPLSPKLAAKLVDDKATVSGRPGRDTILGQVRKHLNQPK
ncbi:hypothetical protein NKJ52_29680 [Mesorhizobium australicum]|uniref:hypothetical protein n=1 Tax=Mesorhizobium australicum TaxID=536018 RepID=UPI00333A6E4D